MKTKVKYRVLNPNGIPPGVPILEWRGQEWFAGDVLEPPAGMSVERILREGYIAVLKGGDNG